MNKKPDIILSSTDLHRIEALLETLSREELARTEALQNELDRADVCEPEDMPPSVVSMNATVRFVIEASGETFCQTLVYPQDADGSADKVSVLAPIGSALLGIRAGQHIEWPRPDGNTMSVLVEEVVYQPERDGVKKA